MATQADIEQAREALRALVESAQDVLREALSTVPSPAEIARMTAEEVADLYTQISDTWLAIADTYANMSGALGQSQALLMLDGTAPTNLRPAFGIDDPSDLYSALSFAMGQDDWQAALLAQMDAILKAANSDAILNVAEDADAWVLWQPSGTKTCSYCLRRASYGAYRDFRNEAQRRGFQTRPHAGCDCRPVIVKDRDGHPRGYDPDAYAAEVRSRDKAAAERARERKRAGHKTPGPKSGAQAKRDRSPKAWAERQRLAAEAAEATDPEELARIEAERAALNGNQTTD